MKPNETFTEKELEMIRIASRLRAEACQENEETAHAREWAQLADKAYRINMRDIFEKAARS